MVGNRIGARPAQTAGSPSHSRSRPLWSLNTESCAPKGLTSTWSSAELKGTHGFCWSAMTLRSPDGVPQTVIIAGITGPDQSGFSRPVLAGPSLGQRRAQLRISGCNHRVIVGQVPAGAILL